MKKQACYKMKRIKFVRLVIQYPEHTTQSKEFIYREKNEAENHFIQKVKNYVERIKTDKNADVFSIRFYNDQGPIHISQQMKIYNF